jgi:hypothetical protein
MGEKGNVPASSLAERSTDAAGGLTGVVTAAAVTAVVEGEVDERRNRGDGDAGEAGTPTA